jgi:hypothetical protein
VRRFVLAIVVGLLALSASGVPSLVLNEPCTREELAGSDGTCPPTCVTCGCCAQAVEPSLVTIATAPDALPADSSASRPDLLRIDPRDILHVPKSRLS